MSAFFYFYHISSAVFLFVFGRCEGGLPPCCILFSLSAVFAAQQRRQLRLSLCLCHRFIRFLPFPHSVFRRAFLRRATRVLRSLSVSSSAVCLCPSLFCLRGCASVSVSLSSLFYSFLFPILSLVVRFFGALECCSLSRFLSPRSVSVPLCLVFGGCGGCPPACLICVVSWFASFSAVGLCPSVFGGSLAPNPLCLVFGGCGGCPPATKAGALAPPLCSPLPCTQARPTALPSCVFLASIPQARLRSCN